MAAVGLDSRSGDAHWTARAEKAATDSSGQPRMFGGRWLESGDTSLSQCLTMFFEGCEREDGSWRVLHAQTSIPSGLMGPCPIISWISTWLLGYTRCGPPPTLECRIYPSHDDVQGQYHRETRNTVATSLCDHLGVLTAYDELAHD